MPCGGIEPATGGAGTIFDKLDPTKGGCWVCGRGGCMHFFHEFDTFIHAFCATDDDFLSEGEGNMIIQHGHRMILDFALEPPELRTEILMDFVAQLSPEQKEQLIRQVKEMVSQSHCTCGDKEHPCVEHPDRMAP